MTNITFNSIYINNFLSIKETEVKLNDQGFVAVVGINNSTTTPQSNGSGKSTIFDAIFWTLTGDTLRGTSDVVNENAGKEGCQCKLDFTDGLHYYTIKRAKGHISLGNACLFYVDGELVSDQIKKSQEMIEKYLPSITSSEILGSIILLGQGLPFRFSSFTPTRRKDILETMSGSSSEIYKIKYKLDIKLNQISQKDSDLNRKINEVKGKIIGQDQLTNSLNSQISSYEEKNIKEEVSRLESEIVEWKDLLKDFEERPDLQEERDRLEDMRQKTVQMKYQIQSSESLVRQQLNSIASGNCPTCGRPYEINKEQIELKEALQNKVQEYSTTLVSLQSKLASIEERQFEVREEINLRNNTYNSLTHKISENQIKLNEYRHYDSIVKDLKSQLDNAEKEKKYLLLEQNNLDKELNEIKETADCLNYIDRQLSRNFKGYILEDAVNFMSKRSKEYGQYLFSDLEIEVQLNGNKINILVGDRQYENLSGGERQRADLAVQFALRDMLSVSSGFSCNLLVLDEVFDNLDAQGSSSLINLITSEFSDVDSMFIVTHHTEIDIPYDKRIIVIKQKDGNSYLSD